jgi:hypothetical protein
LVQYMITIPAEWKQFTIDTAARTHYIEQMYKAANPQTVTKDQLTQIVKLQTLSQSNGASIISFSENTVIPDAIKQILETSVDFLKLSSQDKYKAGQAQVYKILTNITSDAKSYVIHYDVYPHSIPSVDNTTQQQQQTQSTGKGKVKAAATTQQNPDVSDLKNVIQYNYLFSGLNNSIIDFKVEYTPEAATMALDTNLNIGVARFKENGAAGQSTTDLLYASSGENITSSFTPGLRPGDPIFFPNVSGDQRSDNATQRASEALSPEAAQALLKSKQEYTQTMAQAHFLSTLQAEITVRGNPNIIAKYADRNTRGGCPPHGVQISGSGASTNVSNLTTAKQQYYTNYYYPRIQALTRAAATTSDSLLNGVDISVYPLHIVVGIYAPNVDTTGNYLTDAPMFTNSFFYNGPYRVLFMETRFSGGEFSHTFTMMPQLDVEVQNDGGGK